MGSFARVLRQGLCAAVVFSAVLVPVVAQAIESQALRINEVRSDELGVDNNEYFELRAGAAGANLAGVTYLVVGDGTMGNSGVIEAVVTLPAVSLDPGDYYVVAETTYLLGTPDLWLGAGGLNFENTQNSTHILVRGFSGANGDDLDTNDDGVLDFTPWTSELDRVALIMQDNPPVSTVWHYGPPTVGPYIAPTQPPYHAYRNGTGWHMGTEFVGQLNETPGAVNPDEDLPGTAMPDSYTVDEDTWLSLLPADGLFVNDYDVDYLLSVPSSPLHSAEFDWEPWQGIFEYLPAEDFFGQDRFVYVGQTTSGYETAPATVTITVLPVDDPPQIHPFLWFSTDEDEAVSLASMDWGDEVDGETLEATLGAGPSHGVLTWDDERNLPGTYTPDADYYGADSFTFAVTDGISWSDTATVAIDVASLNDLPVATDDFATVNQGAVLTRLAPGVLSNDTDVESPLSAVLVDEVDHGLLVLAVSGQYIYVPDSGFGGQDSFSYRASDGVALSATATVAITVRGKTELAQSAGATIAFGAGYAFTGTLRSNGTGVPGQTVVLETSTNGANFSAGATKVVTGAGGAFSFPGLKPERKTWYRARFAETTTHLGSVSSAAVVSVKPYVGTPVAPSTMKRTKSYTVYGYLKPRHTSGTYPVRIYKYKKTASGKWKSYGYVKAKASNYSTYTKYSVKLKLTSKGKWRVRAYAPADTQHVKSWSSRYDYITVK